MAFNVFFKIFTDLIKYRSAWFIMGYLDAVTKYRATVLGPLWITISLAIIMAILSLQWSIIFGIDLKVYVPYFATGLISWTFIGTSIIEISGSAAAYRSICTNSNISIVVLVARGVMKNFIIFLHNTILLIPIYFYFDIQPGAVDILYWLIGIFLICLVLILLGTLTAVISVIYNDFESLISAVVQASFFLTPVIWFVGQAGRVSYLIDFNPFYHLIVISRDSLLYGHQSTNLILSFYVVLAIISTLLVLLFVNSDKLINFKKYL
jgi:ABC-type polysaccharide/polyol phosphate export permease